MVTRLKFDIAQNIKSVFTSLLFICMISSPLIKTKLMDMQLSSNEEKRELASAPVFPENFETLRSYPKKLDDFYSDNFGFRKQLTKLYGEAKLLIGDSPSPRVTKGQDGWYFLGSIKKGGDGYSDPMGDIQRKNLFTSKELEFFANNISAVNEKLQANDIAYLYVIAPNKHTIYHEKLPHYIKVAKSETMADQLVAYLLKHTDVAVLDLRKPLLAAKNNCQLYYKFDTHWNKCGANYAQKEIFRRLNEEFEFSFEEKIWPMDNELTVLGDLIHFMGINPRSDIDPQPLLSGTCIPQREPEKLANKQETHSYYCENKSLKALIFRDSYFTAIQPFTARSFGQSKYYWKRLNSTDLLYELKTNKPDIVIEEWVERSLPTVYANDFTEYNKQHPLVDE